jgi:hypothetical protein
MKTLHLTIRRKPFDMIASGEKLEEYREIKYYWYRRLLNSSTVVDGKTVYDFKRFDRTEMRNGYGIEAPTLTKKITGIRVGKPKVEWADGMDCSNDVFIIDLEPGRINFCFECSDQHDEPGLYCSMCRLQLAI